MFPNTVSLYIEGIKALNTWFANDPTVVDVELASKRSTVCASCPLNQKGALLVESVAKAIKRRMEVKLCRELHVDGIEAIHTCSGCSCYLPVKIWFPLQQIYPRESEKKNYDSRCWILNEA